MNNYEDKELKKNILYVGITKNSSFWAVKYKIDTFLYYKTSDGGFIRIIGIS